MTSSPAVPTFVAFLPKHLGVAADADGASDTSDVATTAPVTTAARDLLIFRGSSYAY
jgi:hypothetical protein